MREKEISEGLGDLAHAAEQDHEVQMARAELYKLAKYAIKLHSLLSDVSETEGLEGWVQSKITKSSEQVSSVYHHLDYKEGGDSEVDGMAADALDALDDMKESKDTTCSDKCCGSDVKAKDCNCPPTCKHCNCNAVSEAKKPDADGDGVPDWADKKPGKNDNADKKKGSKPKKGKVPPQFKKKIKEDEPSDSDMANAGRSQHIKPSKETDKQKEKRRALSKASDSAAPKSKVSLKKAPWDESIKAKLANALAEKKKSPAGGPACWTGKKIGSPATKMKGGKRVNNCVPK